MEGISRPRRWAGRFMVYQVKKLKQFGMVHHPVCPIEVSVVDDEHEREGQKEINPAMVADVLVELRVGPYGIVGEENNRQCAKDQNGNHRIENISPMVGHFWHLGLYAPAAEPFLE